MISGGVRLQSLRFVLGLSCALVLGCGVETSTLDEPIFWSISEGSRIGSLDDLDQALTAIARPVLGSSGELFVPQPGDANVRVYDSEGRLLRLIGQRGNGPGEFQQMSSVGFIGDTLYIADVGRVTLMSASGEYLTSEPLSGPMWADGGVTYFPGAPQDYVRIRGGDALVKPGLMVRGPLDAGLRLPVLRLGGGGGILDTIVWWAAPAGVSAQISRGGQTFSVSSPFPQGPFVEILPDGSGVVIVDWPAGTVGEEGSSTFAVLVIDLNGDTLAAVRHPYVPLEMTSDVLASELARVSVFPRNHSDAPSVLEIERALRAARGIPSHRPPVSGLAVGQDGTIWIRREASVDSVRWDALGPNGQASGSILLPKFQSVVAARNDVLITRHLDELDVPYLTRYVVARN